MTALRQTRAPLLLAAALAIMLSLAPSTAGTASGPTLEAAAVSPDRAASSTGPGAAGFRPATLRALAREARRADSTCLLVSRRGRLVKEWNWGVAPETPREVFSVTKSITSTLVGLADADGRLSITDRAARYIPKWRGTPAAQVRIDDLLSNDSGRQWDTDNDYGGLFGARNRSKFAIGLRQDFTPGQVWAYNNAAIQTLDAVLHAATGRPTHEYAARRLFAPLGMTHTRMTQDRSGGTNTYFGTQSTCRDLERFGRLFLQRGRWGGERLVAKGWVKLAIGQSSQPHNAAYGRLWWVNREGPILGALETNAPGLAPPTRIGRLVPDARPTLYAALGLGGQIVLVDPASRVVVVRLGPATSDPAYTVGDTARIVTEALK